MPSWIPYGPTPLLSLRTASLQVRLVTLKMSTSDSVMTEAKVRNETEVKREKCGNSQMDMRMNFTKV